LAAACAGRAICTIWKKILGELLTKQTTINIVEVGANDGRINDPIYNFVMNHKETTCVLLIEPQAELIPILKENYKEHRSVTIFNGAIGPVTTIALFRVKPALWRYYKPPYMQDAPLYRVPSGFASGSRQHVLDHARGNLSVDLPLEQCIEEVHVSCRRLIEFEGEVPFLKEIDLLQIDTEGLDDAAVFSCNIDVLKPKLINYEFAHLGRERQENVEKYLLGEGYRLQQWSSTDVIAIAESSFNQSLFQRSPEPDQGRRSWWLSERWRAQLVDARGLASRAISVR
jgi:FkbM family methyltransferase